jgi:hypothetical protein
MGIAMQDYEIRLYRADGTLSIVIITTAASDADAKEQAGSLLREDMMDAQIWCGSKLTVSVRANGRISSKKQRRLASSQTSNRLFLWRIGKWIGLIWLSPARDATPPAEVPDQARTFLPEPSAALHSWALSSGNRVGAPIWLDTVQA